MNDGIIFDRAICTRVIEKIWLRSWLFAMFSIIVAFGYLVYWEPVFHELFFMLYFYIAMTLIMFAMLFKYRHKTGRFGTNEYDTRLIQKFLDEERHWWGKPIFTT